MRARAPVKSTHISHLPYGLPVCVTSVQFSLFWRSHSNRKCDCCGWSKGCCACKQLHDLESLAAPSRALFCVKCCNLYFQFKTDGENAVELERYDPQIWCSWHTRMSRHCRRDTQYWQPSQLLYTNYSYEWCMMPCLIVYAKYICCDRINVKNVTHSSVVLSLNTEQKTDSTVFAFFFVNDNYFLLLLSSHESGVRRHRLRRLLLFSYYYFVLSFVSGSGSGSRLFSLHLFTFSFWQHLFVVVFFMLARFLWSALSGAIGQPLAHIILYFMRNMKYENAMELWQKKSERHIPSPRHSNGSAAVTKEWLTCTLVTAKYHIARAPFP